MSEPMADGLVRWGMSEEMDPESFMPRARKACPGPPHERPEAPWDYPCWECRLDAYFAVRLGYGEVDDE